MKLVLLALLAMTAFSTYSLNTMANIGNDAQLGAQATSEESALIMNEKPNSFLLENGIYGCSTDDECGGAENGCYCMHSAGVSRCGCENLCPGPHCPVDQ
jgi:predicted small secreted protein